MKNCEPIAIEMGWNGYLVRQYSSLGPSKEFFVFSNINDMIEFLRDHFNNPKIETI